MRVLVTGGAGYIGSHTVKALLEAGHEPVIFDSLEKGHRHVLAQFPSVPFIEGDVRILADIQRAFRQEKVAAVIHFAAYIEAGESVKEPMRFFENNTLGAINVLKALRDAGVEHFIFSSTAAVYGEPDQVPIPETAVRKPTNPYGTSKLLVEHVLETTCELTPLKATILRYFNACGADPAGELGEQHQPETHLIPLTLQVANGEREAIQIFGTDYPTPDGTAIRDYIHVSDLAQAHVAALEAQKHHNRKLTTYNVGTGQGYSVREIITTCREITGHAIPAHESPRRAGDPAVLVAKATKIKQELDWQPQHSDLRTIIATAWQWHQHKGSHHE